MEQQDAIVKKKGGRPKKAIKRDRLIAFKCTADEHTIIEERAAATHLFVSEYLRELALTGKIDSRNKVLPQEVLQLKAELNHMGANMNQIARRRNGHDELTAIERASLEVQSRQLKDLVKQIKSYLL